MTSKWEKTARVRRTKLSKRHERLLDYYFGEANFFKTKALRMAGYKSPEQYLRLFSHPRVAEEMERRYRELRERQAITYDNVMGEIAKIAFSHVFNYAHVDRDTGDLIVDFRQATAADLSSVVEVTTETYVEGKGENGRNVKRVRVKSADKLRALDMLMRHAGMSKDDTSEGAVDLANRIVAGQRRIARNPGTNEEESE